MKREEEGSIAEIGFRSKHGISEADVNKHGKKMESSPEKVQSIHSKMGSWPVDSGSTMPKVDSWIHDLRAYFELYFEWGLQS